MLQQLHLSEKRDKSKTGADFSFLNQTPGRAGVGGGGGGVVIAQTLSNISCLILSPFYAREIATMNKQMLALVRLLNFEILKQSDDLTSFGLVSLCSGQVGRFIFDLLKKGEQLWDWHASHSCHMSAYNVAELC